MGKVGGSRVQYVGKVSSAPFFTRENICDSSNERPHMVGTTRRSLGQKSFKVELKPEHIFQCEIEY